LSYNETQQNMTHLFLLFFHIIFYMEKDMNIKWCYINYSWTNQQFKMTSSEHKTVPLAFKKILSGVFMRTTEYGQTVFFLNPWELIKNSQLHSA
jgi:hypothetical protein